MDLLVRRRPSAHGATVGELFVNGVRECWTLEDVIRDGPKVAHETAIPNGRYRVALTPSRRFGRMLPELLDVPGFAGVRIHPGNTADDTSGCILVGQLETNDSVEGSRLALAALQPKIARALAHGEEVWITVAQIPTVWRRDTDLTCPKCSAMNRPGATVIERQPGDRAQCIVCTKEGAIEEFHSKE